MSVEQSLVEGDEFDDDGYELRLGETLGWRAWSVIAERTRAPRLKSATHGTMWPTNRWTLGTCGSALECGRSGDGWCPGESCSCGLYAAKDLEQLLGLGYARWQADATIVVGQVAFSGKVVPGTQGWRAQRGRIAKLFVPLSKLDVGLRLGEVYRVPVEPALWWANDRRLRPHGM